MRFEVRTTTFDEGFVKRFTDLFPPSQEAYRRINRHLGEGRINDIATFLLSQNTKFSAQQIRDARQPDGTLSPEFSNRVDRVCAIAELYQEVSQMLRTLT